MAAPLLADPIDAAVPGPEGFEVGPLAIASDPMVAEAERRFGPGAFTRLLAGARAFCHWRDAARSVRAGDAVLRSDRFASG
ncbi:MAG: hypothetical protein AAFV77_10315, partial [Planctomycetota bacterium]